MIAQTPIMPPARRSQQHRAKGKSEEPLAHPRHPFAEEAPASEDRRVGCRVGARDAEGPKAAIRVAAGAAALVAAGARGTNGLLSIAQRHDKPGEGGEEVEESHAGAGLQIGESPGEPSEGHVVPSHVVPQ